MKKIEKRQKEVSVVADVLCNMCEKSCRRATGYYGLIEATVSGGYDSHPLEDETLYTFSICEDCLKDHVFDRFVIPPEEKEYGIGMPFAEENLEYEG